MLPALSRAFDSTTTEAAATISAYAIAYGVMQLVYGPLGDRFGKPRVIMLASGWCAFTAVLAAAAPSLETLVIARAAMGAGTAALLPLGVAWIGDTVPLAHRQQTLARYSGVTAFGMVMGPLLGGLLTELLNWRAAFVLLVPLFGGVMLRLWVHERHAAAGIVTLPVTPPAATPYGRRVAGVLRDPWSRFVLVAACIEAGLGMGALAFVPTVLHARFGLSLTTGGAIAALFGLGGFLFTLVAALLLRLLQPGRMPGTGAAVLAVALLVVGVSPHWGGAALGCTLAGFGFFMLHNTLQLQATQLSAGNTGLSVSLFTCSIFIGQSVGVSLGALVIDRVASAWLYGTAGVALLLLGFVVQAKLRARTSPPRRGTAAASR